MIAAALRTIASVVIIMGVISAASPEGSLKRGVRYVLGVSLTAIILIPLMRFTEITDKPGDDIFYEIEDVYVENCDPLEQIYIKSKEIIGNEVVAMLSKKYKLSENDIKVEIIADAGDYAGIDITCIKISLPNDRKAAFADLIKKYVEDEFMAPVIIEFA